VGGLFRASLQVLVKEIIESHQRQLVEVSLAPATKAGNEQSTNCRWWDLPESVVSL
jgi:hypothetical protein